MSSRLQLLIAEDSPEDAKLLLRGLKQAGFDFDHHVVDTETEYLHYLHPELDIIISDYQMPQFGGVRALQLLREREYDIPFIIVSGMMGEDLAVDLMKMGATDYLLKDRLGRLGLAVTQALTQGRMRKERQRTLAALRESEERFRQVVQNIEQVFWMTDIETGELLFVSDAYEKVWGRSCESLYSNPSSWLDAVHPLDKERMQAASQQKNAGGAFCEEYRIVRPDGLVRWISDRAFPVRNAGGAVYRLAGIAEDITERRQRRADLRLFRNLVDNSNDTFEVIDPETSRFLDVNAKGPAELGCTREEYLSLSVLEIDPTMTPPIWRSVVGRLCEGEFLRGESFHVRRDGSRFPVEYNAKWVQMERPYIVAAVRDITERKRAEARVHEQAAMLDMAHDAIIVRGFYDHVITFWNKGAERLYEWKAEEAVGRRIDDLIFLRPGRLEEVNAALLKREEWRGENEHFAKGGRRLRVSSRATLVRDEHGVPKAVFVIHTDITEQKELEAQLLRAQRMESIGTLASGVAHDLNNILAPIMMSAPLLRRELPAETKEELISSIELCATRGSAIVKQVLTFGRGLEGEKRPMQLASVIKEISKILGETLPKNIEIETALSPGLWFVMGDATQLHQVLLNLCVNARDAMPCGGKLKLRASNIELDESYVSMLPGATVGPNVLFEVEDTGTGIPPETIDQIFDPFFTTKGVGKGTGLGLSTVLGIVKSHGGHVGVKSELGVGTKFQIYLPAATEDATSAASRDPASARPPRGDGECILVVDDEEHVRRSVQIALEDHGYIVRLANDGAEALALFAQNIDDVALVLTDLMMPYMDGDALIHALRRIKADIPIIASTGLAGKRQIAELEAIGVNGLLIKPYGNDAMLHRIHEALRPPA